MSEFTRLLRNSRLSALPKNKARHPGSKIPLQQVVETRANALSRNEWGLKAALPSKLKSRYITFNDLDNMERIVDFEAGGSFHWKQKRFQETRLVPNFETQRKNPLFFNEVSDSSKYLTLESVLGVNDKTPAKKLNKILDSVDGLRLRFQQYLLEKNPTSLKDKSYTQDDFESNAIDFLSKIKNEIPVRTFNQLNTERGLIKGTGGLTYELKGRLANSPNGIKQNFVGTGRFTNSEPSSRVVAFGGFLAETPTSTSSVQHSKTLHNGSPRIVKVPFIANKASVKNDGSVNIKLDAIHKRNDDAFSSLNFNDFRPTTGNFKNSSNKASSNAEDLLKLIMKK